MADLRPVWNDRLGWTVREALKPTPDPMTRAQRALAELQDALRELEADMVAQQRRLSELGADIYPPELEGRV